MAIKLSGYEFRMFWSEENTWFPPEQNGAVDDEQVFINDEQEALVVDELDYLQQIIDSDRVKVVGGYVTDYRDNSQVDLEMVLRKWLKKQSTTFIGLNVPNDKVQAVRDALAKIDGVKIVGS